MFKFLEVFGEDELPKPPDGKKYFMCIGGNKNFQCFLEDKTLSRGMFMKKYQDQLSACLQPVFKNESIQVRQDAQYAVPGFFIVSPVLEYAGLGSTPDNILYECLVYAYKIRNKMLLHHEVKDVYIYYDENYSKPTSTHFWVLPIYTHDLPSITKTDIWRYIRSFEYSVTKDKIMYWIDYLKEGGLFCDR